MQDGLPSNRIVVVISSDEITEPGFLNATVMHDKQDWRVWRKAWPRKVVLCRYSDRRRPVSLSELWSRMACLVIFGSDSLHTVADNGIEINDRHKINTLEESGKLTRFWRFGSDKYIAYKFHDSYTENSLQPYLTDHCLLLSYTDIPLWPEFVEKNKLYGDKHLCCHWRGKRVEVSTKNGNNQKESQV